MKKKIGYSLLCLLLAGALLTGCEAAAAGVESEAGDLPKGEMSGGPGGDMQGGMPDGMPDGMQAGQDASPGAGNAAEPEILAENQSQITGRVVSVVGNEVELALGSYGSSGEGASGGRTSRRTGAETPASADGSASGGEGGEKPALPDTEGGADASPIDVKAKGEEAVPDTESAPEESAASSEAPESGSSSGEAEGKSGRSAGFSESGVTQTLLVPVGLTLSGSSGRSRDYSSITSGMILRVTMETLDDGTEAVVAVRVLSN